VSLVCSKTSRNGGTKNPFHPLAVQTDDILDVAESYVRQDKTLIIACYEAGSECRRIQ
jgi:hypothetical protein